MSANTHIDWCDMTFNPWIGCTKVSPGCANCYAENDTFARVQRSKGRELWGKGCARHRTSAANWRQPLRWNNAPGFCNTCGCFVAPSVCAHGIEHFEIGRRPRVFCGSLCDVFDDEVPIEWLADLLLLIYDTPNLDWLLLTKRPENWDQRIESAYRLQNKKNYALMVWLEDWIEGKHPTNIWIGTTVENQEMADKRIPELCKIHAAVRFLSCEPLLGTVDIEQWIDPIDLGYVGKSFLDWVICGGESGSNARPMHPDWARSLRDQCQEAGVPFFFKQWGEWEPFGTYDGRQILPWGEYEVPTESSEGFGFLKKGKKAAGRLLDGVIHNAFPKMGGAQ